MCSCWPCHCCCLLFVGWCLSCGVVCMLLLISLVVTSRVDMLRLTFSVVDDMCCDGFVTCVVPSSNVFVVVVIVG